MMKAKYYGCEDNLTDSAYFNQAYKEACELTAYLCQMFDIDPNGTVVMNGVKVPTILCHQDSYQLGMGGNHSDIYNWFPKHGKNMTNVRADVAALLNGSGTVIPPSNGSGSVTTDTFRTGDIVKIIGKTYYSGKEIPAWVLAKNWVVHSVSGNRVVINKSEDGKNSIMSPINAVDIQLASTETTVSTVTGTPSTGSAADEKTIWDFLLGKIGNEYGVAGLMGNLYGESALRSNNLQNAYEKSLGYSDETYTSAVDTGKYTNFVKDSAGYGLAQWTYYTRKQALLDYAKSCKKSVGDFKTQLEFLYKELSGSYANTVLANLKNAKSVKAASDSVLTKFERPADQSDSVKSKRAEYGQTYYNKYAAKKPETEKPVTPTLKFSANTIVNFAGGKHYSSANAASGDTVKASKAKITDTYPTGKHPYHCRAVNDAGAFVGGVYGWVDENTLSAITTTTAPSTPANTVIEKGDTVKITGTKYYSGTTIPSWVKAKNWIVYEAVTGKDRVVIDKSADGKNSIMSPIKRSDLALVKKG